MAQKFFMTREQLEKHQAEFDDYQFHKKKENEQKIKEAREQGDLSENAEYEAAREEQREITARIEELDNIIKNAVIIEIDEKDKDKVHIGCIVKVYNVEYDEEVEYEIEGTTGTDILKNRISNECPVGKALMGHSAGETVKVQTPGGMETYQILAVNGK